MSLNVTINENEENFKDIMNNSWSVVLTLIWILGFAIQVLILKFIKSQPSPKRPIDVLLFIDQVSFLKKRQKIIW